VRRASSQMQGFPHRGCVCSTYVLLCVCLIVVPVCTCVRLYELTGDELVSNGSLWIVNNGNLSTG